MGILQKFRNSFTILITEVFMRLYRYPWWSTWRIQWFGWKPM